MSMHGYYTGLEKLFLMVARRLGEATPTGGAGHKHLLEQMAHASEDIRPAIILPQTFADLHELRRFRHLVRNIYVQNLDPSRITKLIAILENLRLNLPEQLLAFADFLDFSGPRAED